MEIKLAAQLVLALYYQSLVRIFANYPGIPLNKMIKNCNIWQKLRTAHHWSNSGPSVEHACGSLTLQATFRNMGRNEGAKYRQIPQKSLSLSQCWRPWIYFSAGQSPWVCSHANTAVVLVQECESSYVTRPKPGLWKYLPSSSLFQLYRDLENLKEKIGKPKIKMYQKTWRCNRCQRLFHKDLTQGMNI